MPLFCVTEIVLVETNNNNHKSVRCKELKLVWLRVEASLEGKRRTKLTEGSRTPSKARDVVGVALVLRLYEKML